MSLQLSVNKNGPAEYIRSLPLELRCAIFYFIPLSFIRSNETKLIKNVIDVYSIDHDQDLTRQARKYYIKNIMPFWAYVFSTLYENEYEGCDFGRHEYDTLELSPRIEDELNK
jgi:hypothetical protein